EGINAMDAGMFLDTLGIAVRTGHHCTEPVMHRFNIPGTIRASFLFYNTKEEIDKLIDGVKKAIKLLKLVNQFQILKMVLWRILNCSTSGRRNMNTLLK